MSLPGQGLWPDQAAIQGSPQDTSPWRAPSCLSRGRRGGANDVSRQRRTVLPSPAPSAAPTIGQARAVLAPPPGVGGTPRVRNCSETSVVGGSQTRPTRPSELGGGSARGAGPSRLCRKLCRRREPGAERPPATKGARHLPARPVGAPGAALGPTHPAPAAHVGTSSQRPRPETGVGAAAVTLSSPGPLMMRLNQAESPSSAWDCRCRPTRPPARASRAPQPEELRDAAPHVDSMEPPALRGTEHREWGLPLDPHPRVPGFPERTVPSRSNPAGLLA